MQKDEVEAFYQIIDEAYKSAFEEVSLYYYTDEDFLNRLDSAYLYQIFGVNFYYIVSDYGKNSFIELEKELKALEEVRFNASVYNDLPKRIKVEIDSSIHAIQIVGERHFRKNQKSESDFAKHFEAMVVKMNSDILELFIEDNGPDSKHWVIKIHSIAFKNYLPKLIQEFVSRTNIKVEFSLSNDALKKRIDRILDKKKA